MKRVILGFAAVAGLAGSAAHAADFDGSRTLLCANMEAMDCVAGEACLKGLPDDIGAPQFMRIDFARKAIVGPKRESPIRTMEQSEGQLLLQGTEQSYGWTIALDQQSGKTVVTILNRDGAFVVFGACTPL